MHTVYVFDLETTCIEDMGPSYIREIIQIGIAEIKYDGNGWKRGRRLQWFVRPTTPPSAYCTNLTGIKWRQLRNQPTLETILRSMTQRCSLQHVWAAWGNDPALITEECHRLGIQPPSFPRFMDLSLYWRCTRHQQRNTSLRNAMDTYAIPFDGRPHNAMDDAHNTATLYMHMMP